jgi:hypothetical protein
VGSRFAWTLHNMVGHPLAEVLGLLGLRRAATWAHDRTLPKEARRG